METIEYADLFDYEFLKALSDWQRGWGEDQAKRRELADTLIQACIQLPDEFKTCDVDCFRKRFIVGGEIVPIILDDDFFDGIASWTLDLNFAKDFKYLVRPDSKFAMIFKQRPRPQDIIVNIESLWTNTQFAKAVESLKENDPEMAKPLLHFKDFQSEVVLRTTLKGSEIEHIVGVSSSFEDICEMGNIPESEREELSIRYAKDPNGIPISFPTYASSEGTRNAVQITIEKLRKKISEAQRNNVPIYNLDYKPHPYDLKNKIE